MVFDNLVVLEFGIDASLDFRSRNADSVSGVYWNLTPFFNRFVRRAAFSAKMRNEILIIPNQTKIRSELLSIFRLWEV